MHFSCASAQLCVYAMLHKFSNAGWTLKCWSLWSTMKQTAQQNGSLLTYGKTDQVGSQVSSAVNVTEYATCQLHTSPSHTCAPT